MLNLKPSRHTPTLRVADDRCRKAPVGGASQGALDDGTKRLLIPVPYAPADGSVVSPFGRAGDRLKGQAVSRRRRQGGRVCVGARAALALSRTTCLIERTAFRPYGGSDARC